MPIYQEMDPELVWKLIEGYQNELDPEAKKLDAFYRQFKCPRCRGNCRKEIHAGPDGGHAFSDPETLVARALLRCLLCSCLFDPHTGMILELDGATLRPQGTQPIK